ncbi:hypothetical protein [Deinococcus soli (ex Cha et al. 2016)]|uniref:Uncharacterized protein n=2 Tax=Deinococcus soli (ex Cha et al. 2016) TaxID=1309411 RepID=A0ACC6KGA4_9DEIO|nr:hypothetical protein [Deinococcus soli (ex Cha et al. 2016)]MDR6218429.1 hypothetical protein [Deinococcus soli (ex Cha et al. 2016)]MDR6329169.1 hypothetical protein [Deinococcus soli (ex Cha et al. 2016)]MDR6751442.1 hypothetical protein [Deinococcus soli (ex Cha et al. 2016)]
MIRFVKADGFGVMIDRDVYRTANCLFDTCRSTTASGKIVDDQFVMQQHARFAGIFEQHRLIAGDDFQA